MMRKMGMAVGGDEQLKGLSAGHGLSGR